MKFIRYVLIAGIFSFSCLYAQTTSTIDIETIKGKQFLEVFDLLMQRGFTSITPVPVQSKLPQETVLGIKIRGQDVKAGVAYPVGSPVKVLVSMGSGQMFEEPDKTVQPNAPSLGPGQKKEIRTTELLMTGLRNYTLEVSSDALFMTGFRNYTTELSTDALLMTGFRHYTLELNTDDMVMTGLRDYTKELQTPELSMYGMRGYTKNIQTDELFMTGLLGVDYLEVEQPPPETSDNKVKPIQPLLQSVNKAQKEKSAEPVTPITAGPLFTPSHAALTDKNDGVQVDSLASVPNPNQPDIGPTTGNIPAPILPDGKKKN